MSSGKGKGKRGGQASPGGELAKMFKTREDENKAKAAEEKARELAAAASRAEEEAVEARRVAANSASQANEWAAVGDQGGSRTLTRINASCVTVTHVSVLHAASWIAIFDWNLLEKKRDLVSFFLRKDWNFTGKKEGFGIIFFYAKIPKKSRVCKGIWYG
jgi:hypothetical protein